MVRYRSLVVLIVAVTGFASAAVTQFAPPDPRVTQFAPPDPRAYARAKDRARARLRGVPCAETYVGCGCYSAGEASYASIPRSTYRDGVIHMLPAPQCVRMTHPQRSRSIWLDDFENQAFIPAGSTPPIWPDNNLPLAERRARYERYHAATIWLDLDRAKLPAGWRRGMRRVAIDFIGRKTRYVGHFGHMGMAEHEIVVDRILSMKPCPGATGC